MSMEGRCLEFKREYVDEIRKTIIAFANTEGGILYIGVEDDGSVCGVADPDGVMLRITNMIRDAIKPDITLFVDCRLEEQDGRVIVGVHVQRGTERPYYLAGKGIRPEGVFVRQGASSVAASENAILRMIRETSNDCYEAARALNQRLTFECTTAYFAKRGMEFGVAQQRTLGLIGEDGTYTNLGVLLSDQCPFGIKLAVFEGSEKAVFKDRKELVGPLFEQLEAAYEYIDRYNRTRSEFYGLERVDMRDYPKEAVRETLLNAVVHRDYSLSAPILISIFDDRVEVVNVGGLQSGISYGDIMLGVSAPRNKKLADVFYRLRLIEAYGTGLMKIQISYREHRARPRVEVSDNAFKVTLPNTNFRDPIRMSYLQESDYLTGTYHGGGMIRETNDGYRPSGREMKLTQREKDVLRLFEHTDYIVRKDIEDRLGVSQATAILTLREMTSKGLLLRDGGGKNLRYRLGRYVIR